MPSARANSLMTLFRHMWAGTKPDPVGLDDHIDHVLPAKHQLSIEEAQMYCDLSLELNQVNRRPIDLLPVPTSDRIEDHEILWSDDLDPIRLLASLEVRRFSGIVRILSDTRKFRTAMLFFKGRVIGCIYTGFGLAGVLLDEQACNSFLSRLCEPDNIVHAYRLEPDLVLAASAIFHSAAEKKRSNMTTADLVLEAMTPILGNLRTGSVVLNTNEGTVCTVYVRLGVIIGVYSYRTGWLEPDIESIVRSLDRVGAVEMFDNTVSMLYESDFTYLTIRSLRLVCRRWIIQRQRSLIAENDRERHTPPHIDSSSCMRTARLNVIGQAS